MFQSIKSKLQDANVQSALVGAAGTGVSLALGLVACALVDKGVSIVVEKIQTKLLEDAVVDSKEEIE